MQAMILAAGLGTRLRPYSLSRPKPLFPVLGKPLLLHTVDRLRLSGFSPIIVNAHYLREQIVDLLIGEPGVIVQQEPIELGTGGGLRMALEHLDHGPLLVTNGDIYHSIDYAWVREQHLRGGASVSMVMHDFARFNKVVVSDDGRVKSFSKSGKEMSRLAFTGIHVLDPALLRNIPPDSFYNIIDLYSRHLENKGLIRSLKVGNHLWCDIGTPADYLGLHHLLLDSGADFGRNEGKEQGFLVGPEVSIGDGCIFKDWGYIGSGADIGSEARLSRVVVWDGARVPKGAVIEDEIIV